MLFTLMFQVKYEAALMGLVTTRHCYGIISVDNFLLI